MLDRLQEYPRPENDSGIGFRFDSSDAEPVEHDGWLSEVVELGASWLTLPATLGQPVSVDTIESALGLGLEPVIWIDVRPILAIDADELSDSCQEYRRAGVRYLALGDAPNLARRWRFADWSEPGLIDRYAGLIAPALVVVRDSGLIPLISPLAAGGDYWDTTFLNGLLARLASDKGTRDLGQFGLAVFDGPPAGFGAAINPSRSLSPRPYRLDGETIVSASDRLIWYDALVQEHFGSSVPLIAVDRSPTHVGRRAGAVEDVPIADQIRAVQSGGVPDFFFSLALGRLTATRGSGPTNLAWYDGHRARRPEAAELKRLPRQLRRFSWDPPPTTDAESGSSANRDFGSPSLAEPNLESVASEISSPERGLFARESSGILAGEMPALRVSPRDEDVLLDSGPIGSTGGPAVADDDSSVYHYLLIYLPDPAPPSWAPATVVGASLPYVARFQPTIGFSLDEARAAQRVTIVGPDASALRGAAESLLESGADAEPIPANSVQDLKRILTEMANRRSRFLRLAE